MKLTLRKILAAAVLAAFAIGMFLTLTQRQDYTAAPLKLRLSRHSGGRHRLIETGPAERNAGPLTLTEFFPALLTEMRDPYETMRKPDLRGVERRFALKGSPDNRDRLVLLFFLHDLFTSTGAADGRTGGLLGIPYYRHWTIPNPRHALVLHSGGELLTALKPPMTHARYDTFADLDRTPDIFLGDLARGRDTYRSPAGKTFATFGWCSEREMAFTALMTLYGYEAKLVQRGSHTWSEVRMTLTGKQGEPVFLTVTVDNTFDRIRFRRTPEPELPFGEWATRDIGPGNFVVWYNERARDPLLLATLNQTAVTTNAADGMDLKTRTALGLPSGTSREARR